MINKKALEIATKAHEGQKRRGGEPYINHPIRVAENAMEYLRGLVSDADDVEEVLEVTGVVGVMHDVLEDSYITPKVIINSFPTDMGDIIGTLRLLTHKKNISYKDYINRLVLSNNRFAMVIKAFDIIDNISTSKPEKKELYIWALGKISPLITSIDS